MFVDVSRAEIEEEVRRRMLLQGGLVSFMLAEQKRCKYEAEG
jgi:hypothetical protein